RPSRVAECRRAGREPPRGGSLPSPPIEEAELSEGRVQPPGRVCRPQCLPWTMPDVTEKPLQRNEAVTESQTNSEPQTGPIRPAQHPGVVPRQCVCPERPLADIQERYCLIPDDGRRQLCCAHIMYPRQRGAEHRRVDPLLGAAALKAGLCLSHAV